MACGLRVVKREAPRHPGATLRLRARDASSGGETRGHYPQIRRWLRVFRWLPCRVPFANGTALRPLSQPSVRVVAARAACHVARSLRRRATLEHDWLPSPGWIAVAGPRCEVRGASSSRPGGPHRVGRRPLAAHRAGQPDDARASASGPGCDAPQVARFVGRSPRPYRRTRVSARMAWRRGRGGACQHPANPARLVHHQSIQGNRR